MQATTETFRDNHGETVPADIQLREEKKTLAQSWVGIQSCLFFFVKVCEDSTTERRKKYFCVIFGTVVDTGH